MCKQILRSTNKHEELDVMSAPQGALTTMLHHYFFKIFTQPTPHVATPVTPNNCNLINAIQSNIEQFTQRTHSENIHSPHLSSIPLSAGQCKKIYWNDVKYRIWSYKKGDLTSSIGKQRFHFYATEQGVPPKMLLICTSPVSLGDKQHSLSGI